MGHFSITVDAYTTALNSFEQHQQNIQSFEQDVDQLPKH